MPAQTIPFIGFAPDISEMTPGVITDCSMLLPSDRGMKGAPSVVDLGFDVLAATCVGSAYVRKLNGSTRVLAGTSSQLYELSGASWTSGFSSASVARWSIAQFGDITLAANDVDNILQSTSGAFTAVANAPKARIVITVPNFAVAFNTQNGSASASFGDSPDRWWSSAYQNPADWAISVANQCVSERLIGGGEFTAAAPFGTGWVAYKEREMFHGYYTGGAEVFNTQRIHGEQGCIAPGAVADLGGAHCFVGTNDIYLYDGARVASIADGKVRQWFFSQLSRTYAALTSVIYERANGRVWIFYVPDGATTLTRALVYHVPSGRWGLYDISSGMWSPMLYPTASGSGDVPAYFNNSMRLGTISGSSVYAGVNLGTGWYGSDSQESYASRVQLLSDSSSSSAATASPKTRARSGKSATTQATSTADASGNFDIRQTAHWHRFDFSLYSDTEVSGLTLHTQPAGRGR